MRAEAHLNLAALQHNLQIVKAHAPQQKILAMIKANAYGHGAIQAAQALTAADGFGVAILEEALNLKAVGINKPIVIMTGVATAAELIKAAKNDFQIVVHHSSQLALLNKTKLAKPIKIWLKIDAGMHRLGIAPEKFPEIYQQLKTCPNVAAITLMTHFADSDDLDKPTTNKQIKVFQELTQDLPEQKSLANSAGILLHKNSHANWVRPGIMLYGASPCAAKTAAEFNLKPVMTLQAKIIAINQIKCNEKIGYGGTYACEEDMPVAVIGIGYGDGYPRHAKNSTPVLINGIRSPLAGRVSMDMLTVDLRNCPQAKIGDTVTLWGEGLPADEIARCANTIAYTLFCGVTQRVQFKYL